MHIVPPFPRRWVGSVRTLRSCAAELRSVCLPGDLTRNPFLRFNKVCGSGYFVIGVRQEIVRLPPPPWKAATKGGVRLLQASCVEGGRFARARDSVRRVGIRPVGHLYAR
jgi:hypothetical protein